MKDSVVEAYVGVVRMARDDVGEAGILKCHGMADCRTRDGHGAQSRSDLHLSLGPGPRVRTWDAAFKGG